MAGTYSNPGWVNESSPALDKTNLDALSNAVVQNQTDIGSLETMLSNYSTVSTNAMKVTSIVSGILVKKSVSLAKSAWASDSTYASSGYNFAATITVSGATSNHVPVVNFGMADAVSGNFAPMAVCVSNGVKIYAKVKPTANMTIGSVVCIASPT